MNAELLNDLIEASRAAGLQLYPGTFEWTQRLAVNQTCDALKADKRPTAVQVLNAWALRNGLKDAFGKPLTFE